MGELGKGCGLWYLDDAVMSRCTPQAVNLPTRRLGVPGMRRVGGIGNPPGLVVAGERATSSRRWELDRQPGGRIHDPNPVTKTHST